MGINPGPSRPSAASPSPDPSELPLRAGVGGGGAGAQHGLDAVARGARLLHDADGPVAAVVNQAGLLIVVPGLLRDPALQAAPEMNPLSGQHVETLLVPAQVLVVPRADPAEGSIPDPGLHVSAPLLAGPEVERVAVVPVVGLLLQAQGGL